MNGSFLEEKSSLKMLGLSFSSKLDWGSYTYGVMAYCLRCWIPNPGFLGLKPLVGAKVNLAFHPSKVDQLRTRKSWELNGKKLTVSSQ